MASIKKHGPRKITGPTTGMHGKLPDQTGSQVLLQDMIETRAWQNRMKNNLRKVLFQFDKGIFNNGTFP